MAQTEHLPIYKAGYDLCLCLENRELGTICWLGGADRDPDVLHTRVSG